MATATKNPPKAGSLTAGLAAERRQLREAATAEIICLYLADEPLTPDVQDLLDALHLEGLTREKFIGHAQAIAANQRIAGSVADRERAAARAEAVRAARDDAKGGVEPLLRQIAEINARVRSLEKEAADAEADLERRDRAAEALRDLALADPVVQREYQQAMRRLHYPDLTLRQRVRELQALLEERDPFTKVLHAEAICKHERADLRAWGERMSSHKINNNRNVELTCWPEYVAFCREELAEILPRVEKAEAEHARAVATLRADLLSALVPS